MQHTPVQPVRTRPARTRPARTRHTLAGALATLLLAPLAACGSDGPPAAPAAPSSSGSQAPSGAAEPEEDPKPYTGKFKELERKFDARLGVHAVDTGTGNELAHNADERFAFVSTFKALAAGAVLREYSLDGLDRVITYSEDDLVVNSPVTEKHVETGMSLGELCDAAVRHSDNTAANLLFEQLGGPGGLEAVLRGLGDGETRMNRIEPELSDWHPESDRDTSTPRAIAADLRAFVLGDVLGKRERARLTTWLRTNTTGDDTIRAGMPKGWVVGDKTGTGNGYGVRNDIAVVWPPDSAPIVMAIMTNRGRADDEHDDKLIAEAAAVVADSLT